MPEGVFCCLPGGPDIGRALVHHPDIATIAFTGSKDVGLGIMRRRRYSDAGTTDGQAGLAEMGGKNAIIVDETADLDDAIYRVVVIVHRLCGAEMLRLLAGHCAYVRSTRVFWIALKKPC